MPTVLRRVTVLHLLSGTLEITQTHILWMPPIRFLYYPKELPRLMRTAFAGNKETASGAIEVGSRCDDGVSFSLALPIAL